MWGYSQIELISGSLIFFLSTISLIATLVTLWLIYDMNRWNGYMLLIFNLTLCQTIYDISFYFLLAFRNSTCFAIFKFLSTFAGLSVTLWTNIISFILFYIVITMKSFHIYSYFRWFFVAIMTISTLIAALEVGFYQHDNIKAMNRVEHNYYYFRIFSIMFNIAIHLITSFRLYRMGLIYNSTAFNLKGTLGGVNSFATFKTAINDPLKTLAGRLKYYPMVQIFTWIGAAWYEFEYGFTISSFDGSGHKSTLQLVCIYMDAICSPSAGLGFFIIFLVVQPTAYAHLLFRIRKAFNCQTEGDSSRYPDKRSFVASHSDFMYNRTRSSEAQGAGASTINPHHHFNELLIAGGSGNTTLNNPKGGGDGHRGSGDHSDNSGDEVCDELDEDELAAQMEDKYSIQGSTTTGGTAGGAGGSSYLFSASGLSGALGSLGSSGGGSHFSGGVGRNHSTGGRRGMSDEEKGGVFF